METVLGLFFFILGTIVGSFLNVVILRYNTGITLGGRSFCFSCGKKLEWYELIPLFSYIFLRGKCMRCRSKISIQYPLVEFFTGIIFLIIYLKFQPLTEISLISVIFFSVIFSLLIVIFVYDVRHKIIPDGLVYTFCILSFISQVISLVLIQKIPIVEIFSFPHVLDLAAGPILFFPFFLLWFVSGGRWIGFGDAKLSLGIGWLLGFVSGVSAIFLAFWIGAAFSILLMILGKITKRIPMSGLFLGLKNLTIKSEIPFAPFLIIALLIVFLFGFDVVGLKQLFLI